MTVPGSSDDAPAPVASGPGDGVPGTDTWQRVHFISPLVRGWIALVAILYFVGRDWFEGLFDAGTRKGSPLPEGLGLLVAGGIVLGVVVVIAAAFFVSWYFTRYQVTADHVRVHSGVVFRQQRQARLDRVQAIDIVQPFLARIFGLAELKFEVADAGESAVRLAFLKLDDARKLRATILARAAGLETDPQHPEQIVEAPEREVVAIPPRRVIGAAVLSGSTLSLVVAAAVVTTLGVVFETPIVATSFIPILIGVVGAYWSALNTGYNFRAATSPDGIRMRYGLLDTRSQTVPPGRVQALGITQSPLWRLKGWYRVTVNVAGYGAAASSEGQARATLLPVGTRDEVLQILALVLPDPGTPRPVEVFSAGMAGRDGGEGFTTTPRRARLLAPFAWRRNGFAVTRTALLIRSGVLWRRLVVVPHERTQSLSIHQGPIDRRFQVSDLQFQTTPGPVTPRVLQVDSATAWELFHGQAVRAAEARRRSGPEQWMRPIPRTDPPSAPDAGAADVPEPVPDSQPDAQDGTTVPAPPGASVEPGASARQPDGTSDQPDGTSVEPGASVEPGPEVGEGAREVMPDLPRYVPAATGAPDVQEAVDGRR
ncbi:PH domain-containing protein [Arthrobacter sp. NPDC092385]|uniref:PH domain-containing protein n=1 Tax=Arthrobacter sp. NPDC092385 TaxID=3363943 RepID=UPI0038258ACA